MGTVRVLAITIPTRLRTGFWAFKLYWFLGSALWDLWEHLYTLYGCVDIQHIGTWKSKAVAHLTATRVYFALSTMVVTDSPRVQQMIRMALQGDHSVLPNHSSTCPRPVKLCFGWVTKFCYHIGIECVTCLNLFKNLHSNGCHEKFR